MRSWPLWVSALLLAVVSLPLALGRQLDPVHLPSVALSGAAMVWAGRRPATSARVLTAAWLASAVALFVLWRENPPSGYGGPGNVVVVAGLAALVVLGLAAAGVSALLAFRAAHEPWTRALLTLAGVALGWSAALGWHRVPCWLGKSCLPLLEAELRRGNHFAARRLAEDLGQTQWGIVLTTAARIDDLTWAEDTVGGRCDRAHRDVCLSLGNLAAQLHDYDRGRRWWDVACSPEPRDPRRGEQANNCNLFFDELATAARWSEVERYLVRACEGRGDRPCENAALPWLVTLSLRRDTGWGEDELARRCHASNALACVARATMDARSRRGDPQPWWSRACELGEPKGCNRERLELGEWRRDVFPR